MALADGIDDLAAAASRSDPTALDALLAAVRPEVLRLCGRLLLHPEEACQDALLAVARGITRFEGRSSFHTWLYGLTASRARSTYRGLRRRWLVEGGALPPTDPPDPRRTSVVAGTRLDLLDALDAVRPDLAEAVVLRDVLGLGYREIAELLGLPEGTVKSRLHEARRQVRRRLTDAGDT